MTTEIEDTIANELANLISEDPTAAKKKYKTAKDLATDIYGSNLDDDTQRKITDAVAKVLKTNGRFFSYSVKEFRDEIRTLTKEKQQKSNPRKERCLAELGKDVEDCADFVELGMKKFGCIITHDGNIVGMTRDELSVKLRNIDNKLKLGFGKDLINSNIDTVIAAKKG